MNTQDIPTGFKQNGQGHLVPEGKIKEIDLVRDDLVIEIVNRAAELQKTMKLFKSETMGDIAAFVELSAEKYGAKLGGNKGNVTLHSYDGSYKLVRANADHINFDEKLLAAKKLIDECIHLWSEGSNDNIRALVDHAFRTDNAGNISTSRVLGLRALNITDEKWIQAMQAISDSVTIIGSKTYLNLYRRVGDTDQWDPIALNLASI